MEAAAILNEFILYVADQARARDFYAAVLGIAPSLDVPGMTEFDLGPGFKLGLMPESGIQRILDGRTPHPASGNGIPRCELYLLRPDAPALIARALTYGATEISPLLPRNWGDTVAYLADPDGHILAIGTRS